MSSRKFVPCEGSSPLARGALGPLAGNGMHAGIIPTRAGSTLSSPGHRALTADHPHSRGEHLFIFAPTRSQPGSSPLARGAPPQRNPRNPMNRIIPARAGSTGWPVWFEVENANHPRSRGEHFGGLSAAGCHVGSSPLARGAPWIGEPWWVAARIIPARAGSTALVLWFGRETGDHPRSRGEHGPGSPRGPGSPWIIPARARSTKLPRTAHPTPRDHPRSRGEHLARWGLPVALGGSSPLARGAHVAHAISRTDPRIIPARAGSTTCPR